MKRVAMSRPGALQMLLSAALMLVASIGPVFVAFTRPSHEWDVAFYGLPAFAITLGGVVLLVLYIVGFVRYCSSKGYSKLIGAILLLCNVLGFFVLLLLPDVTAKSASCKVNASKSKEVTRSQPVH